MTYRALAAATTLLAIAGSGVAADTWTGFSVGIDATYAQYTAQWDDQDYFWYGGTLDERYTGVLAGLRAAYDHQWDSLVLGIDANVDLGDIQGSHGESLNNAGFERVTMRDALKATYAVRIRAGLAVERTLLYGMVGPAWVSTSHRWTDHVNAPRDMSTWHDDHQGWIVGVGLERIIAPHWSVNADLYHLSIPDASGNEHVGPYHLSVAEDVAAFQLGLNYRF